MRLGSYNCKLVKGSLSHDAYKSDAIMERHRHRYELNNKYKEELLAEGMIVAGYNENLDLVEIVELKNHPWFVAVQFHPEYQRRRHGRN